MGPQLLHLRRILFGWLLLGHDGRDGFPYGHSFFDELLEILHQIHVGLGLQLVDVPPQSGPPNSLDDGVWEQVIAATSPVLTKVDAGPNLSTDELHMQAAAITEEAPGPLVNGLL